MCQAPKHLIWMSHFKASRYPNWIANVHFNSRQDLHLKASPADGSLANLKNHPAVSLDVPNVKDIHSSGNDSFPKPTFKPSMEIPVNERGYTKSSLKLGREVHKEYKALEINGSTRRKEFVLPSGRRVDFIDFENQTVYELKPNNPKQIKLGVKQLQGYIEEINAEFGGNWKGVLDTY